MQNASKYPRLVALPVLECIDCVSDVGGVALRGVGRFP
ncbi:hypothetical protein CDB402_1903 [Corynebacterium diphtheriae INCA 402]|nr:hypothetical protein CDB402_1903 [Corynebacterium diphtheriae INCA 402]